jgi:hypothetical protein
MTKKIYYEKRGRRYVPVSEYDSDLVDSFPKGNHLIMCYPGGKSVRYNVDPALAPMIAAGRIAEDHMCEAIWKAGELRPKQKELTIEQQRAWKRLIKLLGDDAYALQINSARDIAEAGLKAMQEEADKLLTNPSVRIAYEKFLMVAALTKENTNKRS